ncbi:MAG: lactate utilization protein [Ferruginibacter sp.]
MAISKAKENILKKIRQALSNTVPLPFPQSEGNQSVFFPPEEDKAVVFAEAFTNLQGKFVYCMDAAELQVILKDFIHARGWTKVFASEKFAVDVLEACGYQPWPTLEDAEASITGCEYLVARTGSMVLSAAQQHGRTASVYAPVHICLAGTQQLVYDIKDALLLLKEKYGQQLPSSVSFASGPSRTADIEKTLVTGVHGPREVCCFLMEQ